MLVENFRNYVKVLKTIRLTTQFMFDTNDISRLCFFLGIFEYTVLHSLINRKSDSPLDAVN